MFLGHLKEKLNFDVDDLCKLPADDLRWQVDYAISQVRIMRVRRSRDQCLLSQNYLMFFHQFGT